MKRTLSKIPLDKLYTLYEQGKAGIKKRLEEFAQIPPSEYFYELVYCLLTPQSSAINAAKAVEVLKQHDFAHRDLNPAPLLHQRDFYIRFHHTKGKHLQAIKEQFPMISTHLTNGKACPPKLTEHPPDRRAGRRASTELREWLVNNVMGLGYKEASHFLRNIGHRNLAILDRHILKNLVRFGVLRSLPKTMTRKRYLAIERKFHKFSERVGIPMDELDLLFWSMETGEILK